MTPNASAKAAVRRPGISRNPNYKWYVVGMLWFCGFFNYADRQAVYSVFPLLTREFGLSKPQLGLLGSAFMVVYAGASPFTGYTVDGGYAEYVLVRSDFVFPLPAGLDDVHVAPLLCAGMIGFCSRAESG